MGKKRREYYNPILSATVSSKLEAVDCGHKSLISYAQAQQDLTAALAANARGGPPQQRLAQIVLPEFAKFELYIVCHWKHTRSGHTAIVSIAVKIISIICIVQANLRSILCAIR